MPNSDNVPDYVQAENSRLLKSVLEATTASDTNATEQDGLEVTKQREARTQRLLEALEGINRRVY